MLMELILHCTYHYITASVLGIALVPYLKDKKLQRKCFTSDILGMSGNLQSFVSCHIRLVCINLCGVLNVLKFLIILIKER